MIGKEILTSVYNKNWKKKKVEKSKIYMHRMKFWLTLKKKKRIKSRDKERVEDGEMVTFFS